MRLSARIVQPEILYRNQEKIDLGTGQALDKAGKQWFIRFTSMQIQFVIISSNSNMQTWAQLPCVPNPSKQVCLV